MKVFGTKQTQPSDADRMASARLSAVAARFKSEPTYDLTEASPDPIGEPLESLEPEVPSQPEANAEPEAFDEEPDTQE